MGGDRPDDAAGDLDRSVEERLAGFEFVSESRSKNIGVMDNRLTWSSVGA
jgi:hypothetical protein